MNRLFALLARDPATGFATAPVAIAGVDPGGGGCVSWVPYQDQSEGWRARLASTTVPLAEALAVWLEEADGIGYDVVELTPPGSPDLRGAVEAALDELLAEPAPSPASGGE